MPPRPKPRSENKCWSITRVFVCLVLFWQGKNIKAKESTLHHKTMLPRYSIRSDDGGARISVPWLIAELERTMQSRGGNHRNITGMDLAVTRTLFNHIQALEARVAALERRVMELNDGSEDNPYPRPR